MTRHERVDDSVRDGAEGYVFGSIEPGEAREFETHLSGCAACRAEVESVRSLAGELAGFAPEVEPPAGLFDRVRDRVRRERAGAATQVWKGWASDPEPAGGATFVFAEKGSFVPTAVPGVEVRRLFVDSANDRVTMLVRMAAGAAYPPHVHGGPEECLVLEGDLLVGSTRMRAGDYQRIGRGGVHGVQSTDAGCLLFIVSSLHDRLLESAP
jgi:anti-sigma factor ChrR (cupin superfamily)